MQSPSLTPLTPWPSALPPQRRASVRNLPVSLFGAVMGLAGLSMAWRLAHVNLGVPAWIGEAIGALAVAVFVLLSAAYGAKLVRHPQAVQAEFRDPVAGNFFGTIAIAVLLLSAIVGPYSAAAADTVWTLGVVATFALGFAAVSRLLAGGAAASHAVPAWLIPGVATLDIAVTGGRMPMAWAAEVNLAACAVGAVMALVLLAMIISRLVHQEPLAPAMTPSLMILVAPFAVGFLAYGHMTGGVDRFAGLLFYFGLFLFALIAPKVFRPGVPFTPGGWAIGFPMAALANAALTYAAARGSLPLWWVAIALLGALTLALAVLTARTVHVALNGTLFR